jgi:hypothetical protein
MGYYDLFLILLNLLVLSMNLILFDLDSTNLNLASLEGIKICLLLLLYVSDWFLLSAFEMPLTLSVLIMDPFQSWIFG